MIWLVFFVSMKRTKGQMEDTISKEVTKYYAKAFGIGPRETKTYIIDDMIVVRLKSKLSPMEEMLLLGSRGVALVKDIRSTIHEITIEGMNTLIKNVTDHEVISTHSDISTKSGEIVQIFIVSSNYEEELKKQSVG